MAVKWGFIQENSMKGVKQLKLDSRLPTYLEVHEIEKFLNIIDNKEYKKYFQFLLYTGC
jgi:site-specific recombinase XerD